MTKVIPLDQLEEHGKSWEQWMTGQRSRIFAEAHAALKARPIERPRPDGVTPFQWSFFPRLEEIEFTGNQAAFQRDAIANGIPRECAARFLKVKYSAKKKGPSSETRKRNTKAA